MPLTPTITPRQVEDLGALTPGLFQVSDQVALDQIVQDAIDYADAWFAAHAGENYGLQIPTYAPILQRRGVMYLALEALTDTLKARKIYGTHAPYMSEESDAYERLIDNEWGQRAREALDVWLTVESVNRGFAKPVMVISDPVPLLEDDTNGLESLDVQLEIELGRARGLSNADVGTVRR